MEAIIHHADSRGKAEYGWLSTRYSFSFANWYNPARMGFGALRVINDDTIAPGTGFGEHSHSDMEIITLVMSGTLTHKDSMGNVGTVRSGEVQVMSAGTGVTHSEYNASETEPLSLFQIWIMPDEQRVAPQYGQKQFVGILNDAQENTLTELVRPLTADNASTESLGIHQDAYITRAQLGENGELSYVLNKSQNGVYAFVISGTPSIGGIALRERDALAVTRTDAFTLSSQKPADILLIEVSMIG